jgi:flavodoxin I
MKSIVIYDTVYGNTEKIAAAIKENIPGATMARANETETLELSSFDLVVVGSPTQGGRQLASVKNFLTRIPAGKLQNSRVAAFDTRTEVKGFFLKLLVRLLGYAAPRILNELKNKGGQALSSPQGFLVSGKEGPIISGEIERARNWAAGLVKTA